MTLGANVDINVMTFSDRMPMRAGRLFLLMFAVMHLCSDEHSEGANRDALFGQFVEAKTNLTAHLYDSFSASIEAGESELAAAIISEASYVDPNASMRMIQDYVSRFPDSGFSEEFRGEVILGVLNNLEAERAFMVRILKNSHEKSHLELHGLVEKFSTERERSASNILLVTKNDEVTEDLYMKMIEDFKIENNTGHLWNFLKNEFYLIKRARRGKK
jgi:hypothetical protein